MEQKPLKLVLKEEAAKHWRVIAVCCLRTYQKLQDLEKVSTALWNHFWQLSLELEVLEHDLAECINEFAMAVHTHYAEPRDLELKKFAVVYHTDNFYVRVHKLIENAYGLAALTVGLDPEQKPSRGERNFRRRVREALGRANLHGIRRVLEEFVANPQIDQAVTARNRFVHFFREELDWAMLSHADRFQEPDDPMARDVREIAQVSQLDIYAEGKREELVRTLTVVREFRDSLLDEASRMDSDKT
jgi:hypothetical protein